MAPRASRSGPRWPTCTTSQRTLRLADGPDEVHWFVVGRSEIARWEEEGGSTYDPKVQHLAKVGAEGKGFSGP